MKVREQERKLVAHLRAEKLDDIHIERILRFERRVRQLEAEGLTRSDAQGVAEAQDEQQFALADIRMDRQ